MRRDMLETPFPEHPTEPMRWWERLIMGLLIGVTVGGFGLAFAVYANGGGS